MMKNGSLMTLIMTPAKRPPTPANDARRRPPMTPADDAGEALMLSEISFNPHQQQQRTDEYGDDDNDDKDDGTDDDNEDKDESLPGPKTTSAHLGKLTRG